jgi:hypothetical protein
VRVAWLTGAAGACSFQPGSAAGPDGHAGEGDAITPAPSGLIARWEFDEQSGTSVADSGPPPAVDLEIDDVSRVDWQGGALVIRQAVLIRSAGPATKINQAIRAAGVVTLEAWAAPANITQAGPARVITLSPDISNRNAMIAQDTTRWLVRLRTETTGAQGDPNLVTNGGVAAGTLAHVVVTFDGSQRRLFLDGQEAVSDQRDGDLASWNESYPVVIANEATGGRAWLGAIHRISVYSAALSARQVAALHDAGP